MSNKFVENPWRIFHSLAVRGALSWMPDKLYLKLRYRAAFNQKLNLKAPQTFSEKIQWLKLYDRNPDYIRMVDKYEVKEYVSQIIGDEYIIPTLGVWDCFDEIDFNRLPQQFVLKCTHDSGGLVICKDKSRLNMKEAREKIEKSLKQDYYKWGREWVYKNVRPRIIAEVYMEDHETSELRDYKFFTFNGVVKAMFIASERQTAGEETRFDFFDADFNHLDFTNGHPNAAQLPKCPENFEKMKHLAEQLSKGIPHVRVDFYEVNGKVYFGELTFAHWSGLKPFNPDKWDKIFGDWIEIPTRKKH